MYLFDKIDAKNIQLAKQVFSEKFNLIKGCLQNIPNYKGEMNGSKLRLLAVQLDGFTHRIIMDTGANTEIMTLSYSAYMPIYAYPEDLQIALKIFFRGLLHEAFKGNPLEIIFISPKDRNKEVDA